MKKKVSVWKNETAIFTISKSEVNINVYNTKPSKTASPAERYEKWFCHNVTKRKDSDNQVIRILCLW